MTNYNDQSLAIPKEGGGGIPQQVEGLPAIVPPTTNEMVTMMLRSAGTLGITDEQKEILFAPVDPDTVEIRPDGLIYLPAMEYREKLCQAFGVGWALLPAEPKPQREGNLIVWPHYLFIHGQPVALVYGEQEYHSNNYTMTYGDAIEGAASNALMRACKRLNVNKELWRPSFIRQWKDKYAEAYIVQEGKNRGKTQWRRKEIEVVAETENTEETQGTQEQEEAQKSEQTADPSDPNFWRRKSMQHAGDLGMTDEEVTDLCKEHFYQYIASDDDSSGEYLKDDAGERIHVTEKKQLHWTQWKQLGQHLYHQWVAAGKPEKPKPAANAPEQPDTQTEASGPAESESEQKKAPKLSDEALDKIKIALYNFPKVKYMTIKSKSFRNRAYEIIDHKFNSIRNMTEEEAQMVLDALAKEKSEILAQQAVAESAEGLEGPQEQEQKDGAKWIDHEVQKGEATGELQEEFVDNVAEHPMTDEQIMEWKSLIAQMPERFHKNLGSTAFRDLVMKEIGRGYAAYSEISEDEAEGIIRKMNAVIKEEGENKPNVV